MKLIYNIKIAYRSFLFSKTESLINVLGLAIGIAFSVVVLMYVRNEFSYDKHYTDYNRIYRVYTYGEIEGREFKSAAVPNPLSEYIQENYQEVEDCAEIVKGINKLIKYKDARFNEDNFFYANDSFFNVFDLSFTKGSKENALLTDSCVVVSEKTALKYFGNEEAMGKTIELDNGLRFVVRGVYVMPKNSHFSCDFIASSKSISKLFKGKEKKHEKMEGDWLWLNRYVYLKFKKGVDDTKFIGELQKNLEVLIEKKIDSLLSESKYSRNSVVSLNFDLQKLKDIHLYSNIEDELQDNSKIMYVELFLFIALFVLFVSGINFINLTTAKVSRRVGAVQVRKLSGISRSQLIIQLIVESILYSVVALFIGLVFVELLLPGFNYLFEIDLRFESLSSRVDFLIIGLITLFIGVVLGLYPAFLLSRFKDENLLQNKISITKKCLLRGLLSSAQILVVTFLIVLAMGVSWQVNYLSEKDLGLDYKNILVVERGYAVSKSFKVFKEDLKKTPGVLEVSACMTLPGEKAPSTSFNYITKGGEEMVLLPFNYVEKDFFKILGINLNEGFVWEGTKEKMSHDIVINSVARDSMKLLKPIGKKIRHAHELGYEKGFNITGIVKDFHFEPIDMPIRPLVLFDLPKESHFDNLLIKFSENSSKEEIVNAVADLWRVYTHDEPFEYKFLTDVINDNIKEEKFVSKMIWLFSVIALIIAWIGLRAFGAYYGEIKKTDLETKKIVGATLKQQTNDVVIGILQFVLVGLAASVPLVYVVLVYWLNDFAYVSFLPFGYWISAVLLIIIISLVNIIPYQLKLLKKESGVLS